MSRAVKVLDASALLAYLQAEKGAEIVRDALARGCAMSTVNWAEVLSKVAELGMNPRALTAELERRQLLTVALRLEPFEAADALAVAALRPETRALGLSLGDRACLALGRRLGSPVLTTDRAWDRLGAEVGVEVHLVR